MAVGLGCVQYFTEYSRAAAPARAGGQMCHLCDGTLPGDDTDMAPGNYQFLLIYTSLELGSLFPRPLYLTDIDEI